MAEQSVPLREYDDYITRLFASEDDALRETRAAIGREGLPQINVSPSEGKLLHVLALICGPRRILEIGTLGGYSTLWLARALPENGKLITLELDPHHAEVSRRSLANAGLSDKTEVRVGPAAETLAQMQADGEEPFDLVFIDADKDGYPAYLELSVPLTRPGGVILADNTLRPSVLDPADGSGISRYNAAVAAHPDLVSILIPVLRNDVDGLLVSRKRA